ncbi:hypothetical protein [Amphritea sp.]|uniref:hypothetical protein n=1 Tax=Amphritea sp. TaxID=1872502 RepID=UPI003A946723
MKFVVFAVGAASGGDDVVSKFIAPRRGSHRVRFVAFAVGAASGCDEFAQWLSSTSLFVALQNRVLESKVPNLLLDPFLNI